MTENNPNRVALITGASKRIGANIARSLHQNGFNVIGGSGANNLIEIFAHLIHLPQASDRRKELADNSAESGYCRWRGINR